MEARRFLATWGSRSTVVEFVSEGDLWRITAIGIDGKRKPDAAPFDGPIERTIEWFREVYQPDRMDDLDELLSRPTRAAFEQVQEIANEAGRISHELDATCAERDARPTLADVERARAEEREACALVAESVRAAAMRAPVEFIVASLGARTAAETIAERIRARGAK